MTVLATSIVAATNMACAALQMQEKQRDLFCSSLLRVDAVSLVLPIAFRSLTNLRDAVLPLVLDLGLILS
jgi:adenylosuccinate lyase